MKCKMKCKVKRQLQMLWWLINLDIFYNNTLLADEKNDNPHDNAEVWKEN